MSNYGIHVGKMQMQMQKCGIFHCLGKLMRSNHNMGKT